MSPSPGKAISDTLGVVNIKQILARILCQDQDTQKQTITQIKC